ncbi:hypothetical protein RIF29_37965 [Crotalaria pallida]|uniref:Phospholipid scramblase n=1 Tax=Crotalaria pallida TaxID=3830 RepID=A0AAN9E0T3_CROPI
MLAINHVKSSIQEIGVVHRLWHLWRRIYDLYLGNKQFAVVENPGFWNWTFTMKDINGEVLVQVDRDWRSFGFEILTDAGQYVIRFGSSDPSSKIGLASAIEDLECDGSLMYKLYRKLRLLKPISNLNREAFAHIDKQEMELRDRLHCIQTNLTTRPFDVALQAEEKDILMQYQVVSQATFSFLR